MSIYLLYLLSLLWPVCHPPQAPRDWLRSRRGKQGQDEPKSNPSMDLRRGQIWLCSRVFEFLANARRYSFAAFQAPAALPIPGDRASEPSAELSKSIVRTKRTIDSMRDVCRLRLDLCGFSAPAIVTTPSGPPRPPPVRRPLPVLATFPSGRDTRVAHYDAAAAGHQSPDGGRQKFRRKLILNKLLHTVSPRCGVTSMRKRRSRRRRVRCGGR